MLKDITLGQYFPLESFIHKLDPRIKILSAILLIIVVFLCKTPLSFLIAIMLNVFIIYISKIKYKVVIKALKPVWFIIIFTAIINLFLTPGENIVFNWKFVNITIEGIRAATTMAIRIILLISFTSLLTFTTSPIMLTDGIESLLKPAQNSILLL